MVASEMSSMGALSLYGRLSDCSTGIALGGSQCAPHESIFIEAFREKPWHTLLVSESTDGQLEVRVQAQSEGQAATIDYTIAKAGTQAIVVLCEAGLLRSAQPLLRSIMVSRTSASGLDVPPVIVVLLSCPDDAADRDLVHADPGDLFDLGVDDVILARAHDVRASIELSLRRLRHFQNSQRELEERALHDSEHMALQVQALERKISAMKDLHNRTWFANLHRLVEEFPKLGDVRGVDEVPQPGATVAGSKLIRRLGKGACGIVYQATSVSSARPQVVKVITKESLTSNTSFSILVSELKALKMIASLPPHPSITQFYGSAQSRDFVYLTMEFAGPQNLFRTIVANRGGLSIQRGCSYGGDVASGLAFLHGHSLAHRDVKPENIVVSQDGACAKIVDFGQAVPLDARIRDICGTMPFMAPEVMRGTQKLLAPSDMWAWGMVFVEMLAGVNRVSKHLGWPREMSPSDAAAEQLEDFLGRAQVITQLMGGDAVPQDIQQVLLSALAADPEQRPTAGDVTGGSWRSHGDPSRF